jgi:hypothetical protein
MSHPYSINLRERQIVYFVLALLSFGASLLIGLGFAALRWSPPGWLDVPGAFGIFGFLSWWFDRQVWRWLPIRNLGISTPILDGCWSGATKSSFDDFNRQYPVRMTIHQTWTEISISVETDQSRSYSTTASIDVGPESMLVYSFTNLPQVSATGTMHTHIGTALLRILPDELVGEYYSGRDRQNIGTIELRRN